MCCECGGKYSTACHNADDLFQTAYQRRKALPDSFGERHAKYGMEAVYESTSLGEDLFECQQGNYLALDTNLSR